MAGSAIPNYRVNKEAKYTVLAGGGGTGSYVGLFDGTAPQEWNTPRVFYWNTITAFVEIELYSFAYIHRYYSWNNNNNQRLKIMKHDGIGYNLDYTFAHLDIGKQIPYTWQRFTDRLPKGRYKFILDTTNTGFNYRCDGEWYIEEVMVNKTLILCGSDAFNYDGVSWVNVGTVPSSIVDKKIFYQTHGMDEVLPESIELLPNKITISTWTDEEQANRTLNVKAIPSEQLILPTKDISIRLIENIDFVRLTYSEVNKGKVRVITSFDAGITWYAHNGIEWININPKTDEVILLGMSPETLANITSAQWTDIRGDSKTMRFAYAISMEDITDSAEIDALITQMDMKGTWKKAVHGTHYDYEYPNNDDLLVTIYADGDYKINY
ncbi:hypothetical protein [Viridibacillus arvi]|uniref:hypothetical protein n=1 Tax=Viridibacillus arvi TaxID=263475 RepID=UPI003D07E24B